jgi:hypothetical protein
VKLIGLVVGLYLVALVTAPASLAQVTPDPTVTPTKNTGGFVYGLAVIVGVLGVLLVFLIVFGYMRFAPRFQRGEGHGSVRADRVVAGGEPPRRAVDVSQAAAVVVAPPAVPVAAGASGAAPAASASAAPAAPAAAPMTTPAAAPAAAASSAPAAPAEAPAGAATPPPAAPAERPEVAMDQETFDAKLEELLAKGTDRRVAEGQARRAGMIAARKKAEG